ncbi:uncharacterized protein LOC109722259 [Ananas comosus]|uniref:RING-type E3 ubiquitin transferase n=1 Tax=Ananas comosus TaxID=4615 RepID=A0A6P5GCM6_ANACO|nr:uncharacterized protein LOC109722259 [Ananas comosus]
MASPPPSLSTNTMARVRVSHSLLLLLLLILSSLSPSSSYNTTFSDHCGGASPEPSSAADAAASAASFRISNGYFAGAGAAALFGRDSAAASPFVRSFSFYPRSVRQTLTPGVLRIAGTLTLRGGGGFPAGGGKLAEGRPRLHRVRPRLPRPFSLRASATFDLDGAWSEHTGELCMVGSGLGRSMEGNSLSLAAVFKLNYSKASNLSTSFITGSLVSIDAPDSSNHFDPLSVVAYTEENYEYTHIAAAENSCSRYDVREESLGFNSSFSCQSLTNLMQTRFRLDSNGSLDFSGDYMSVNRFRCTDDGKVRMYLVFTNWSTIPRYRFLVGDKALVGEGVWDQKRNRLCAVACNVLIPNDSTLNFSVGDCSLRMSFWFPAVWSIKRRSNVLGQIWSDRRESNLDNISTVSFMSIGNYANNLPGVKYNYTMMDAMSGSCMKDVLKKGKKGIYPAGKSSNDFVFNFFAENSEGKNARGYANLVTIGEVYLGGSSMWNIAGPLPNQALEALNHGLVNVSYQIFYTFSNKSSSMNEPTEISAEGVYNTETGSLCLVGCRYIGSLDYAKVRGMNDSIDCEIVLNFQFAPLNAKSREHLKGIIRSKRERSDLLFFEPLEITSYGIYVNQAVESIQRMDLEIAMVLISSTFSCIFVGMQLFHVKKNPDVLPSISITMLVILTLSYMIPLVLNFEALFFTRRNKQNILSWSGGWLEANEIIVRVITMVAFLLQVRLLQVAWTARSADENKRGFWVAERKGLWFCLPLYLIGGLTAWFIHIQSSNRIQSKVSVLVYVRQRTLWEDLISYAGLILDGFLLPQFTFNLFSNSKDKSLASSFYVGNTLVRALPHVYDAYRARRNVPLFMSSYLYASPGEDLYTLAWDIVIPCVGILLAALIYLQQRFGGACFLPSKHKQSIGYEMVPVVSS